jgi:hypothetical protein
MSRRLARGAEHLPALRRLPVVKLLALADVVVLARQHLTRLDPAERRRFLELVRAGRGRRRNLSPQQRAELASLIAKARAREFLGEVADRFSPIPLPKRVVRGRSSRRR